MPMDSESTLRDFEAGSIAKRKLILRDSLAILSLCLATVVLFAITLFLFKSFSAHRADLARRWSDRGLAALQAGKPAEAVVDLRTALTYAPDTRAYELLLAQALGEAGCKGCAEESYQYFLGLWDAEPGNGEINLQLARLAKKRNDRRAAVNFYRAAIYGTWEGDGVGRRAGVRMELARYLIEGDDLAAARLELLIAGGNAPDDFDRDMSLADLLQQAQDPTDAWTYYQRAIAAKSGDPAPLEAAGRLAYQVGDYENAHRMLAHALAESAAKHAPLSQYAEALMETTARIQEMMPSPSLPARDRVDRIVADRAIARKRIDACTAKSVTPTTLPPALQALDARWSGPDGSANAAALLRDSSLQDSAMQLVYDTEVQTSQLCGPATGDDALLLRLATMPHGISLAESASSAPMNVPRD
jgi:Tfp pilus assembly protein PilF